MFKHIMAPVDLAHIERLARALAVTADAAKHYGAKVTFVSATASTPGSVAHSPEEFRDKLADFAASQASEHGIDATSHPLVLHDAAVDLDHALLKAVDALDVDLVIMASHKPSLADYFWSSNGGAIAGHAGVSVMIVRDI
ncbi:universal stress protein [Roseivivax sp. CAU 1753]